METLEQVRERRITLQQGVLEGCRRVVVKVGSATLTKAQGLDRVNIHRICDQMAELKTRANDFLLVSSGAVAAGMRRLGRLDRPQTIPEKQAAAAIGQNLLMQSWEDAFDKHDLKVAQVLLTYEDFGHWQRYLNARYTLDTLLRWDVLPIINENDTVAVDEIKFGDNDQLAAWISGLVGADLVVILTDIDGLYDRDPRKHEDARLLSLVEEYGESLLEATQDTSSQVGTGGMRSKILAARKCMELGIPMVIVNGRERDVLLRLFAGEPLGTLFMPRRRLYQGKKWWLARLSRPQGTLILDRGAVEALGEQGRSLLPIGVTQVRGDFEAGAPVHCLSEDGQLVGVGLCNYSGAEVRLIKGAHSEQIEERIGYKHSDEVIHRDHFVLAESINQAGEEDAEGNHS